MGEMQQATDMHLLEAQVMHCSEAISLLCDSFMTLELQLVDQLEVRAGHGGGDIHTGYMIGTG